MASEKVQQIIDTLNTLSVLEISELSKALQEVWGVTAAAPVAMAAGMMAGGGAAAPAAPPEEEKTEFTVTLTGFAADKKIEVIKAVRALTQLGLKEAKDLVEASPKPVVENVNKESADKAKQAIEAAGGTVTVG
ncbi:MAG: 50S ribosomal protein L7/L12 [Chloroflexi bacterium]|nr:50S ribosomal protein L7/L12 [Chloroflexota bacterium]